MFSTVSHNFWGLRFRRYIADIVFLYNEKVLGFDIVNWKIWSLVSNNDILPVEAFNRPPMSRDDPNSLVIFVDDKPFTLCNVFFGNGWE